MNYFDTLKIKDVSSVMKQEKTLLTKEVPVKYDEERHLYTADNVKYTSASGLAEKFHEPFPADAHIKYAAKYGNTPEYWLAKWKEKNNTSKERGNKIHDNNEMIDHARMIDTYQGIVYPVISEMVADTIPWINRPDGVYTERMLWHHGYRLAGRADKIILTNSNTDRYASIKDYKTNEKLNFVSYQYTNGNYKMMKFPIAHVMDCNWMHYCIQQSVYMLMLEYQGFLPGNMTISHYPHPTEDNLHPVKQDYHVPYMKKEVIAMCNFLLK